MQESRELIQPFDREKNEIARQFEPKLPIEPGEPYRGTYRGAAVEENARFLDYWRAIRKRLWLVAGVAVLVTTLTAIYMARRPDVYQAKAQVQVDLEQVNPELVTSERRSPIVNTDPAYFNTQLQILNSPALLRRVVKEMNLESNADFLTNKNGARSGSVIWRVLGYNSDKKKTTEAVPVTTGSGSGSIAELAEAKRVQPFVEELQKNLIVEPVREGRSVFKETRLIDVSYRHTDPELAALIVNTVADSFTKNNQERRSKSNVKTNDLLQKRVADLQTEIKNGEQRLASLSQKAGIIKVDQEQTIVLNRLAGLNKQLLEAENARKLAEAEYNAATAPEALTALTEDSAARKFIDDTTLDLNKLRRERARLLEEFTEEADEVKQIDQQIKVLETSLENYRQRTGNFLVRNLKTRFEQTRAQEDNLRRAYNEQYNQAQVQNQASVQLKLLQGTIDTNKGLLDNISKQQRENDVIAIGTDNNISVVDIAIPPDEPVAPRRLSMVLAAFVLSLAFGCGLALFLEYLDDTVRTAEDAEKLLRLPALAVIPAIDSAPRRKLLGGAVDNGQSPTSELIVSFGSRSALAEAYRQLRTSILLSSAGRAPKSLLVTSSVPSEGKTTTAVNTAISLAQTGASVLLIDADMRRPRLHSIFNLGNEQGLSSILSSQLDAEEILDIVQQDAGTNLHLLTSGPVPPNPAELIGSEQMTLLLRAMENHFTHVVVDSPPISSFTDGVLIGTMVDGVLLVVHSGKSSRQVIRRSRQLLQDVGAKVFGLVLNKVDLRSGDTSYYQNYYNSYYSDSDKS